VNCQLGVGVYSTKPTVNWAWSRPHLTAWTRVVGVARQLQAEVRPERDSTATPPLAYHRDATQPARVGARPAPPSLSLEYEKGLRV
jgi:hypothetical protein